MIISIEKARGLVEFPESWTDDKIKMKLLAVEQTIRAYTNNNFQDRGYRIQADIAGGVLLSESPIPFSNGDTVQISESQYNTGLYTVSIGDDQTCTVSEQVRDELNVCVTKVVYPADVIDCCVNLLEWEVKSRGKVGIKSETISRHSVTYEDSASMFRGYPKGILNSVFHYRKVRC